MSDREKKLLFLLGFAAFLMANFFAISWFSGKRQEMASKLNEAQTKLEQAHLYAESFDKVLEEREWLSAHYPEPKARQTVEAELEQFGSNLARTSQLELKPAPAGVKILAANETGRFHRAKVQFAVSGDESNIVRWLHQLHDPEKLRANTFLRLSPKRDENTKADCTVIVEQWYIPPDGEEAQPEQL